MTPCSLAHALGADGLQALQKWISKTHEAEHGSEAAVELSRSVFTQLLQVVTSLQFRLQGSEGIVADLQAKADGLEEKRRALTRRAERIERDRDEIVRRYGEAMAATQTARQKAAPMLERFMEAEVLRNHLQTVDADVMRLREELAECLAESARASSSLMVAEEAQTESKAATAELDALHKQEIAALNSRHSDTLAELREQHAGHMAQLERSRQEELQSLQTAHAEELGNLRTTLEDAHWQADTFARERQDMILEVCLRQRENARVAKRHAAVHQEALDLAVKLEALRVAETGTPAREAELQAMRHRHSLLQQTKLEWQEALSRKKADCEAWRQRAFERGMGSQTGAEGFIAETNRVTIGKMDETAEFELLLQHAASVPTPCRNSKRASRTGAGNGPALPGQGYKGSQQLQQQPASQQQEGWQSLQIGASTTTHVQQSAGLAEEFLAAALRVVELQAVAQVSGASAAIHRELQEAGNDLEMLAFLLDGATAQDAEYLLECEAQRQPPTVATALRRQRHDLLHAMRQKAESVARC